jgi:hypothetical protein
VIDIWCKVHSFKYSQGINEIASIVSYALFSEKIECNYDSIEQCKDNEDCIKYMQSSKYLKHDIYSIFERIMEEGVKELFIQEGGNLVTHEDKLQKFKKEQLFQWSTDISQKSVSDILPRKRNSFLC